MSSAKGDKTRHLFNLSVEQLNAIDILITGASDQETADKVGVSRSRVSDWRNHHPGFQAELNKRRKEIWGASMDKMRALVLKALDTLEGALSDLQNPNRWKIAVKLLEIAGIQEAELSTIGEDDPNKIVKALAKAEFLDSLDFVSESGMSRVMTDLTGRLGSSLGDLPKRLGRADDKGGG